MPTLPEAKVTRAMTTLLRLFRVGFADLAPEVLQQEPTRPVTEV